ncbi:MAG TPA: peptidoglycan DD-metalloendopeptidase family protein [Flavisolibacter sp.]|jgi:murein DD-endopeptidase MepM/ murein hydrolase activator NlpD|nr:peptidoglycan DD-metalloendopeptidase family protein [Flavisolibacter sp.]
MHRRRAYLALALLFTLPGFAQNYPQGYFRSPLNIPLQLVANFGEIRTNHWHMGLDIRTQQRVNLPVFAAADGYIARVSVEPGGFGQAIYINHPNGYTTLYGHLNAFMPALAQYVKQQQYERQSWAINLYFTPQQFPVSKSDQIALSGSTGASEGPHVHFEIRDTKTENCLNPLLFQFPLADAVAPTLIRLALYDRNKSTYLQTPQFLTLKKAGSVYTLPAGLKVGSNRISFAVGAVDRFTGSANPNGIYSAATDVDGTTISAFRLDDISYNDTRYINAQIDYPYHARGGAFVQHISPLPGAAGVAYTMNNADGIVELQDNEIHPVQIEVKDANGNTSRIQFTVQYDPSLQRTAAVMEGERFLPNNVNVYESEDLEVFTTEWSVYDTIPVSHSRSGAAGGAALSAVHSFLSAAIPAHDSVTIRIRPEVSLSREQQDHVVIRNLSGTRTFVKKADWQQGWLSARFRQFGTYQAFLDEEPPTVNAPPTNLSKATRLVFTPRDNFNTIRSFRCYVNGQWLRFTNDKGKTWIYSFDEYFPRGSHELKVVVEDEAGNVLEKSWTVTR